MQSRLAPSVVIALGIVTAALVLQFGPTLEAQGPGDPKPFTFREVFEPGETKSLGTIPVGRTVLLKDFWAVDPTPSEQAIGWFEVLVDGQVLVPISLGNPHTGPRVLSFSVGFEIPGGSEIAIRRDSSIGGPEVELYMAGTVR